MPRQPASVATPLDRERPLWEIWFVEGLERGDRFAAIWKIHHCMTDGTSGVELVTMLMSLSPDEKEPGEVSRYVPRPPPGNLELLRYWEEVARIRYESGIGTHADVIRAQVELGKLEDRLRKELGLSARDPGATGDAPAAAGEPAEPAAGRGRGGGGRGRFRPGLRLLGGSRVGLLTVLAGRGRGLLLRGLLAQVPALRLGRLRQGFLELPPLELGLVRQGLVRQELALLSAWTLPLEYRQPHPLRLF